MQSYETFLYNVQEFKRLNAIPVELNMPVEITAEELAEKEAVWHKSCHLKFASTKLYRIQDKVAKSSSATTLQEGRKSKRQVTDQNSVTERCIFCDEQDGDLHQVLTF